MVTTKTLPGNSTLGKDYTNVFYEERPIACAEHPRYRLFGLSCVSSLFNFS